MNRPAPGRLMELRAAEKATRVGAAAGFVSAILTLVVVALALSGEASGRLEVWNDPWHLLDVVLVAGLSFGVLRKSRAAALVLFFYFVVSKVYLFAELGRPRGIGLTLAFLYFFGKAIHGTFVHHRIRRDEDPEYRPPARWHYFVWPPVGLVVLFVVLLGLSSILRLTPATTVIRGEELREREIALLVSKGLLQPAEPVVLFYSEGLLSVREGGSILTERRVVSYEEVGSRFYVEAVEYEGIANLAVEKKGDFFNDTVISVTTDDGRVFRLLASPEKDGDALLIEELRERWQAARN